MSRRKQDLWPTDFGHINVDLPVVILREQAALLGAKTRKLVEAIVKSGPTVAPDESGVRFESDAARKMMAEESWLEHRFQLIAPALDNYTYELFTVAHRVAAPYPLRLLFDGKSSEVKSPKQYIEKLEMIFKSAESKRVIATLIQQSQAA